MVNFEAFRGITGDALPSHVIDDLRPDAMIAIEVVLATPLLVVTNSRHWQTCGDLNSVPSLERRGILTHRRQVRKDWSGHRVTISAPQFGRLVDIHLSHTRILAEGRRHDHHTVSSAICLANSAQPCRVDLPWSPRGDSNTPSPATVPSLGGRADTWANWYPGGDSNSRFQVRYDVTA